MKTTKADLGDLLDLIVNEIKSQAEGNEPKLSAATLMAARGILKDNGVIVEPIPDAAAADDIMDKANQDIDIDDSYDAFDNVHRMRR